MAACARYFDLSNVVDLPGSQILGARKGDTLASVLGTTSSQYVQSDSDEQLLFHFAFTAPIKLHSVRLTCSGTDNGARAEDASGPRTVRLFANRTALDFSDAETIVPTQELEFKPENIQPLGDELKTAFVKFQLVKTLDVFIQSNQDDTDVTRVDLLQLIGLPTVATDMSKLTKVG